MDDLTHGERLTREEYKRDFWRHEARNCYQNSWKLVRRQTAQEPGSASWEAFSRGDWDLALRILAARNTELLAAAEQRNALFYRVRVVEQPLTPYLQWELHSLRQRAACGEQIRVVGPAKINSLEQIRRLPDLVVLGDQVLYQVLYTDQGIPDGALRFASSDAIAHARGLMRGLYAAGEDLRAFFGREVSHLPPPSREEADE